MSLFSIFQYDFMIRAFVAGIITALIAPMIGIFIVTRRYSFMADTLAHVSLAGVAIGFLTGTQPIVTAMIASALTALAVEHLRSTRKVLGESALALFLSGGLALAAVLLSAAEGFSVNLGSVLFGSIATVNEQDIVIISLLGVIVLATILFLFKELVAISFDEELAIVSGLPVKTINRIFVVLTAVTVSLSMRIVGTLLIGALMVIPVIAAMQWERSFRLTLALATLFSLSSMIAGLFISYQWGLSSGGVIVLLCMALFFLSALGSASSCNIRLMIRRRIFIGFILAAGFLSVLASDAAAQGQVSPQEQFSTAKVLSIMSERETEYAGMKETMQQVQLQITSGPETGEIFTTGNGVLPDREDTRLSIGETVVLDKQIKADGSALYLVREKYRLPSLVWLTILFVFLSVLFGGRTGITSILGLGVSVLILIFYIIPRIVAGSDPLAVSLIGSVFIACTSLYLAHGFNKRTSIAFLSTIVTLAFSAVMAIVFVRAGKLFGMGSEESVYLQSGLLQNINLRGLLLGGIIIGCLGVLDDVTTAQTAAIDEISKANPALSISDLRTAGASVGKEHIASLINTLALAYVGASLPLLLLLKTQTGYPLWVTINGEFLAEEIIRTLVGSATLLLAVPISTGFAAYFLQGGRGGTSSHSGYLHAHPLR